MPSSLKLGYLVFNIRRPDRWADFCHSTLGLPDPVANPDDSQGYQIDDVTQRLIVEAGKADDLAALGLECDREALDGFVARLRTAGVNVETGSPEFGQRRRVAQLHRFADPDGNWIELHTGPEVAPRPFASSLNPGGFRTGDLGLGHAVLVSRKLETMERFYVDLLGFAVSERLDTKVGPIHVRGTFLHCNRRHHSLALFDLPLRKQLHHFMLQANALADVGVAFERSGRNGVPLSLGLGQHPDPDGTFSFYGQTPSGFDFEIGAGGGEIEPKGWQELRTDVTSSWGHKPRRRLRLKMVKELVVRSLGR